MNSSWIRATLKYALLLTPAAVLAGLIALVAVGAWVGSVIRKPERFAGSPVLIQKLARVAYWHTRRHWQTVPECVVFDTAVLYRPRPGSCVFQNAEFRTTMHFDELGARRTLEAVAVPGPSPPRLVIVGDSHAMGWGVEDDETFASFLASEHGIPTVNLGVSSYGTPRELLRLARDFPLRPDDVIVIQYCDNDLEENRYFAAHGTIGPYDSVELETQTAYQPTRVAALPIGGLLLRLLWDDALSFLTDWGRDENASEISPTAAFLRVIESTPQLRGHRLLVVAINGPGLGTHLSADHLAADNVALIVPVLAGADFLNLDDHMRPAGHAKVAAQIAAALTGPAPSQ